MGGRRGVGIGSGARWARVGRGEGSKTRGRSEVGWVKWGRRVECIFPELQGLHRDASMTTIVPYSLPLC